MLLSLFSGLTLDFYSIRVGNVERQFRSSGCKSREVDVVLYGPVPNASPGVSPLELPLWVLCGQTVDVALSQRIRPVIVQP
jgi:hypothetical protein